MTRKNTLDSDTQSDRASSLDEVEIDQVGEAEVERREEPVAPPPGKTIHRRRPLPAVPDRSKGD